MGSSLPLASTDSGTSMPIESGEESISSLQLTKLRAAPVLRAEVPPCAPAGESDGVTASQLIASVGPLREEADSRLLREHGRDLAFVETFSSELGVPAEATDPTWMLGRGFNSGWGGGPGVGVVRAEAAARGDSGRGLSRGGRSRGVHARTPMRCGRTGSWRGPTTGCS